MLGEHFAHARFAAAHRCLHCSRHGLLFGAGKARHALLLGGNGFKQFFAFERLGQVVVCPQAHAFAHVGTVIGCSEHDDGGGGQFGDAAQGREHVIAVHHRHIHIGDDDVGQHRAGNHQAVLAVGGGSHFKAFEHEQALYIFADGFFIVNYQHTGHIQFMGGLRNGKLKTRSKLHTDLPTHYPQAKPHANTRNPVFPAKPAALRRGQRLGACPALCRRQHRRHCVL